MKDAKKRPQFLRQGELLHILLCIALTTFFTLSVAVNVAQAQPIRIGVVQDQTGFNFDVSSDYLAGARTYFDHINARGGVRGRKIELVVRDDGGDAAVAVTMTQELIQKERVDALFGYTSDEAVSAVARDAVFRQSKIPMYAPVSGTTEYGPRDGIYFMRPSYRDEAKHVIRHFGSLGIREFAIAAVDTPLGKTLHAQIREELEVEGRLLLAQKTFASNLRSLDGLVKDLLNSQAKVVIVAADSISMAEFVRAFRKRDLGTILIGFSIVNYRTLVELATPEFAASTILTRVVPNPNVEMSELQIEHLKLLRKYREEPPSHLTLEGFIAAKSFVRLIERAPSQTRVGIAAALATRSRDDLGGITLLFAPERTRISNFVDLAYLRRTGVLIH